MDKLTKVIEDWAHNPERFVMEALCLEKKGITPTSQQKEGLEAVRKLVTAKIKIAKKQKVTPEEMELAKKVGVSIMAGRGPGKDTLASWLILWFLCCFPFPKIPCTANTGNQLKDVLWSEINKWIRGSLIENWLVWQSEKIYFKEFGGREWFAIARTVNTKASAEDQAETLAGRHEDYMMIVVDEACHDNQTDILTENGWRRFSELKPNTKILTKHPDTHEASYKIPVKRFEYDYEGEMYGYQNRACDFLVTPNHNMYCSTNLNKNHLFKLVKIKELTKDFYLERKFKWSGIEQKDFILKKIRKKSNRRRDIGGKRGFAHFEPIKINMDSWLGFLGWYFSEGSVTKDFKMVYISQKNPANKKIIKELITQIGFKYNDFGADIRICSKQLGVWLKKFGKNSLTKKLPRFIFKLPSRQIRIFLENFLAGDGFIKNGAEVYYTSSPEMADDLQELILKTGRYASKITRKIKGQKKWILNHWATSTVDGYVISTYKKNNHIKVRHDNITKTFYKGKVFCVEVLPHHLIYTRRNGKCMWSGNSGIPEAVFRPLEGGLTGVCNFILMLFNPTRRHGFAIGSHQENRQDWVCLHWDAEKSERVTKEQIERMERKYGRDSNAFRISVTGLPPLAEPDTLIPWDWVMEAVDREILPGTDDPLKLMVDVGAGGDKSVITHKQGGVISKIVTHNTPDTMELAGWVVNAADEEEAEAVFIDVIGLGNGVFNRVRELRRGNIKVYPVDVRRIARNQARFKKRRDELWWALREEFEQGTISIPNDDELIGELSTIKYTVDSAGKVKVEGKQELKKRGLPSPNKADTLMMAHFMPDKMFRKNKESSDSYRGGRRSYNHDGEASWMGI